jgi:DNA-binding transcriptional ArsR family regulator
MSLAIDIDCCQYRTPNRHLSISTSVDQNGRVMARSADPDVIFLQALADPVRLAIVRELAASPEICACDFTTVGGVSQPTVSHHLKVLREAGVVTGDRRGSWIFYRLAPNAAERLARIARGMVPGGLFSEDDLRRPRDVPVAPGA